jgi:Protein of unknown function (DUF2867)
MRLPKSAHTSRPWRIHELRPQLRVEDVWALPTPGGPDDFPRLVEVVTSWNPAKSASTPVRLLFALRFKVGELFGWDGPSERRGFTPLYVADDEWAAETVNRTVHGVLHLGWVENGSGGWRGQLAVLVEPNGLLGHAYMAAIKPFRHFVVYPKMLRELGRAWQPVSSTASAGAPRGVRRP